MENLEFIWNLFLTWLPFEKYIVNMNLSVNYTKKKKIAYTKISLDHV